MEVGEESFIRVQCDDSLGISSKFKAYSDAKLHEAEKHEQELLEKPFLIEKILNKLKCKSKCK